jgi:hypothetical protein
MKAFIVPIVVSVYLWITEDPEIEEEEENKLFLPNILII